MTPAPIAYSYSPTDFKVLAREQGLISVEAREAPTFKAFADFLRAEAADPTNTGKAGSFWCPATFSLDPELGLRRKDKPNWVTSQMVVYDLDSLPLRITVEEFDAVVKKHFKLQYIIHNSYSDGLLKNGEIHTKCRLAIPFCEPVKCTLDEYEELSEYLWDNISPPIFDDLGLSKDEAALVIDRASFSAVQGMYTPRNDPPARDFFLSHGHAEDGLLKPQPLLSLMREQRKNKLTKVYRGQPLPESFAANGGNVAEDVKWALENAPPLPSGSGSTAQDYNYFFMLKTAVIHGLWIKDQALATKILRELYRQRAARWPRNPVKSFGKIARGASDGRRTTAQKIRSYLMLNFGYAPLSEIIKIQPSPKIRGDVTKFDEITMLRTHLETAIKRAFTEGGVHVFANECGSGKSTNIIKNTVRVVVEGGSVTILSDTHKNLEAYYDAFTQAGLSPQQILYDRGIQLPNAVSKGNCLRSGRHTRMKLTLANNPADLHRIGCGGCDLRKSNACEAVKNQERERAKEQELHRIMLKSQIVTEVVVAEDTRAKGGNLDGLIRLEEKDVEPPKPPAFVRLMTTKKYAEEALGKRKQNLLLSDVLVIDESPENVIFETHAATAMGLRRLIKFGVLTLPDDAFPAIRQAMKESHNGPVDALEILKEIDLEDIEINFKKASDVYDAYSRKADRPVEAGMGFLRALEQTQRIRSWNGSSIIKGALSLALEHTVFNGNHHATIYCDGTANEDSARLFLGKDAVVHRSQLNQINPIEQYYKVRWGSKELDAGTCDFRSEKQKTYARMLAAKYDDEKLLIWCDQKMVPVLRRYFKLAAIRYHRDSGSRGDNVNQNFETVMLTVPHIPTAALKQKAELYRRKAERDSIVLERDPIDMAKETIGAQMIQQMKRIRLVMDGAKRVIVVGNEELEGYRPNQKPALNLELSNKLVEAQDAVMTAIRQNAFLYVVESLEDYEHRISSDFKPIVFRGDSCINNRAKGEDTPCSEKPQKAQSTVKIDGYRVELGTIHAKEIKRRANDLGVLCADVAIKQKGQGGTIKGKILYLDETTTKTQAFLRAMRAFQVPQHHVALRFNNEKKWIYGDCNFDAFFEVLRFQGAEDFTNKDVSEFFGLSEEHFVKHYYGTRNTSLGMLREDYKTFESSPMVPFRPVLPASGKELLPNERRINATTTQGIAVNDERENPDLSRKAGTG